MLHPFISSPATRGSLPRRASGVSFSVVIHSTLIAGAVVATMPPPPEFLDSASETARPRIEHIAFVRTMATRDARDAGQSAEPREPKVAAGWVELAVGVPSVTSITAAEIAAAATPDVDLESETAEWVARQFSGPSATSAITDAIRRVYAAAADGAYERDVVEKTVWPRPNNPVPRYPSALLSVGVEAHVLARFVVDSSGRVSEKSLIFPENAHRLFVDAVRRALMRSRYFPAELAGRRVAQHVIQEFVFRIER